MPVLIIKIISCILPAFVMLLLLCFFQKKDGFTFRFGLLAILLGLVSIIPITAVQFLVSYFSSSIKTTLATVLVTALLFNGVIEESFKMVMLLFLPAKKTSQKVFFAASLLSGLVLGCFETVIYLVSGQHDVVVRLVTSVLVHTACSGLSGLYVWSFKQKKIKIMPFVLAAVLHGLYNFFAGFTGGFWWISIVCLLFAFIECALYYDRILEKPDENSLPLQ